MPAANTVCSGKSFTQTRTLSNCAADRRSATGTRHCPPSCRATSWSPATNTVCGGKQFTQTRQLSDCSSDSRSATGTKYCPPSCRATSWSPATNTVCSGKQFTQTRTLSDCSNDSRSASGAKSCPRTCTPSGWQPAPSAICSGNSFTQTRTLENCKTASRNVTGTKCCGAWSAWSACSACKGKTCTSTRTHHCTRATQTKQVRGTMTTGACAPARPTCRAWYPPTGNYCQGVKFTQHCAGGRGGGSPNFLRTATGTKSCRRSCPAGSAWGEHPFAKGSYCCKRYNYGGGILSSWSCVPGTSILPHP